MDSKVRAALRCTLMLRAKLRSRNSRHDARAVASKASVAHVIVAVPAVWAMLKLDAALNIATVRDTCVRVGHQNWLAVFLVEMHTSSAAVNLAEKRRAELFFGAVVCGLATVLLTEGHKPSRGLGSALRVATS